MTKRSPSGGASYRALCFELLEELKQHLDPTHLLIVKAEKILTPPVNGKQFKPGEENFSAILTPELVRKMRKLREEGWSYRKLASEFDVDEKHAWRICNRNCWAWVK